MPLGEKNRLAVGLRRRTRHHVSVRAAQLVVRLHRSSFSSGGVLVRGRICFIQRESERELGGSIARRRVPTSRVTTNHCNTEVVKRLVAVQIFPGSCPSSRESGEFHVAGETFQRTQRALPLHRRAEHVRGRARQRGV